MNPTIKTFALLLFLSIAIQESLSAQALEKSQAAFIYNFALFINWPDVTHDNFTITVLGSTDVAKELENMTQDKKVGEKPIVIKKVNQVKELGNTQIIFIPSSQIHKMKDVLAIISTNSTLVVTECEGCAKKGSVINFLLADNKLKFELNHKLASAKGLKVPDKLVKLGILVE